MAMFEVRSSKSVAKDWREMEEKLPDAMRQCKKFLQESPLDRLVSGGKLKKLKGKLKGFLQYDIDNSHRVWYVVKNEEHVVEIKYIGPHPG